MPISCASTKSHVLIDQDFTARFLDFSMLFSKSEIPFQACSSRWKDRLRFNDSEGIKNVQTVYGKSSQMKKSNAPRTVFTEKFHFSARFHRYDWSRQITRVDLTSLFEPSPTRIPIIWRRPIQHGGDLGIWLKLFCSVKRFKRDNFTA